MTLQIMNLQRDVDTFTTAYIECALWSSTEYKFGECPCCGKMAVLDRLPELEYEQTPMCSADGCGVREIPNPDPMDQNYSWTDLADETLAKIVADCKAFQDQNNLTGYPLKNAGHDFWLTRNGHGCGFWENDFGTPEQCELLHAASKRFGECNLYVGDDGKLYI